MIFAFTGAFVALDFLTGIISAFAANSFSSTKMRQGLFHKSGLTLCVILGVLVDQAQRYLDLGAHLPVAVAVCTYICLMEISSIIENICKINPDILPDKLTSFFGSEKGDPHD